MAIRASEVVVPRFNELTNVKCISDFIDNPVYKDKAKVGVDGVKADFLVMDGPFTGFVFTAKFKKLPAVNLMDDCRIVFDTEETRVYVQNGNLGISFWATGIEPLKKQS